MFFVGFFFESRKKECNLERKIGLGRFAVWAHSLTLEISLSLSEDVYLAVNKVIPAAAERVMQRCHFSALLSESETRQGVKCALFISCITLMYGTTLWRKNGE